MTYWNRALMIVLAIWAALATWRLETSIVRGGGWHDAMTNCPMYRAEKTG